MTTILIRGERHEESGGQADNSKGGRECQFQKEQRSGGTRRGQEEEADCPTGLIHWDH